MKFFFQSYVCVNLLYIMREIWIIQHFNTKERERERGRKKQVKKGENNISNIYLN